MTQLRDGKETPRRRDLLALALAGTCALAPVPAFAQSGITCALVQAERDTLVVQYARSLVRFDTAAQSFSTAAERLSRFFGQFTPAGQVPGEGRTSESLLWELILFNAEYAALRAERDAAQERAIAATRAMVALEATLLAVNAQVETICANGGVGETVKPGDDGDAEDAPAHAPGLPDGFYLGSFGFHYYVAGGSFTRLDWNSVRLSMSCGGHATLSTGDAGEYCSGQWYNRRGLVQGSYEGVIQHNEGQQMRIRGLYARTGGRSNNWNFRAFTPEEIAEFGLQVPPG